MRWNGNKYLLALAVLAVVSCQENTKLQYAMGDGVEKEQEMPDSPDTERIGFTISTEESSLRSVIGTGEHIFSSEDRIYFRSSLFSPVVREDGTVQLDVASAESGNYRLFCLPKGSEYWYRAKDGNPMKELVIPYSQIYRQTVDSLAYFPLYGQYSGTGDGQVVFKEILSAVGITLRGNAKIASVHLQNNAAPADAADNMAGVASYDPEKGFVLSEGVDFINLNCTNGGQGVPVSDEGNTFYLVLAPGNYQAGMTLTVTDMDHKGQQFAIPGFDLNAGEVKVFSYAYSPEEDLLFFEHFDNFVWGGNVKGNPAVSSFAPDALSTPSTDRRGTEEAFATVGVTTPGSAFIQSNWATVNGWTVRERANVSADYVKSRNIGDYTYLYRCQEYQGCVSVGVEENRGGIQPKDVLRLDDACSGISLDFDICLRYGTEDQFCTQLDGSGIVTSLSVDGVPLELQNTLEGNNTYSHTFRNLCTVRRADIPGPTSERYTEGWHHVHMTLTNMNELSALGLWGYDSGNSIKHGAFIDNIEIRHAPVVHPEYKLRVLLYNIQNGMWSDQGNDFDNFVAFVKRYDPDVCIFCEAQSLWKTGSAEYAGKATYQLFTNKDGLNDKSVPFENAQWEKLAERMGHSYHAVGAYKDDYPQVITSKYPITTVNRINSGKDFSGNNTGIVHGSGHYQVTVGGQTVNFVSLHMWPMKYAPGESPSEESQLNGYEYARREVEAILTTTAKRKDCGDDWLIMGDTNSVSPLDGDYYDSVGYSRWDQEGYKWVLPHEAFRSGQCGRQLYDMLREGAGSYYTGPGRFMTSTSGAARMDIMYGSESMRRRVTGMSFIVHDKWSDISYSAVYDPDSDDKHPKIPSDHLPLLIEFDMSK